MRKTRKGVGEKGPREGSKKSKGRRVRQRIENEAKGRRGKEVERRS